MGGTRSATTTVEIPVLEKQFRATLIRRRPHGGIGPSEYDHELHELVGRIAADRRLSPRDCLQQLLQAIVDEESAAMS